LPFTPGLLPEPAPATPFSLLPGPLLTPADLAVVAGTPAPWRWHGYLGPGKLTLLTSQWKSGKTALLSGLLARMATGGTLAALPVTAGRAVIVSEEAPGDWHLRCQHLGIGDHTAFLCRPFQFKLGLNAREIRWTVYQLGRRMQRIFSNLPKIFSRRIIKDFLNRLSSQEGAPDHRPRGTTVCLNLSCVKIGTFLLVEPGGRSPC
jgi:hypothetical protein